MPNKYYRSAKGEKEKLAKVVQLSHPDKILYPEQAITKLDLLNYYNIVHSLMLPVLINRPLTLLRCPQGRQKKCFYQRHLNGAKLPHLYAIKIPGKARHPGFLYIKDKRGLFTLVQLGVLEIHTWGCRIDSIEKPDFIVFDLDPAPEVEWKKVIETAFLIKEKLSKLNLISFIKTTGGKGLHIVIPIKRQYSWDKIKIFAHIFMQYLVSLNPLLYAAQMSKAKRKGKIFIDYLRNQLSASTIAPYSTRARKNAPVATPLAWDELSARIKSDSFTVKNLALRLTKLKQDPWEDFLKLKQTLRLPP
jgi:bifunctional non-homologous end joining protein LigD